MFLLACLKVAQGPQCYTVVQYIDFRYRDLKEGRNGAQLSFRPLDNEGRPIHSSESDKFISIAMYIGRLVISSTHTIYI